MKASEVNTRGSDERKLCCAEDAIGLHTTIRIEWTREEPHPPTKEETFITTILQLLLLFSSTALEGSGCTTAVVQRKGRPKSISDTHTQNNPLCIKPNTTSFRRKGTPSALYQGEPPDGYASLGRMSLPRRHFRHEAAQSQHTL